MEILYEDDYLIAVNKPPGLASVPAAKIPEKNTLMGQMQTLYAPKGFRPYILHRLDRETSGIVLFGKFPRNRQMLEGIFSDPHTKKVYLALVKGLPKPKGIITFLLEARSQKNKRNKSKAAKIPAKTTYRVVQRFRDVSLVEAAIETGRHHQIRKHFAEIGHSLVNDFDYGDKNFNRKFQQKYKTHFSFLHAKEIQFKHPVSQKMLRLETPLPKPFQKILGIV